MKIGIITYHFPINYGAVLQAYALQKTLETMGHSVSIIDYQPDYQVKKYQWIWSLGGLHIRNLILPGLRKKFKNFRRRHLRLTPRMYRDIEELRNDPPVVDAYICGSDQIWNPDSNGLDPAYFLAFVPHAAKRIAYAASFGKTTLNEMEKEKLRSLIQQIDHVSIREQSGVELIAGIGSTPVEWVLDPTLLMNNYESITAPSSFNQNFVLVLNLQNNPLLNQTTELVSRESGYPVVVINNLSMKFWSQKGKRCYPSPEGYLGLIKAADFVVTNSFHGTIFSILFNKPFLTTALGGQGIEKNTRMTGLLTSCGLSGRFIDQFSNAGVTEAMSKEIDWAQVRRLIENQRELSLNFLKTALESK